MDFFIANHVDHHAWNENLKISLDENNGSINKTLLHIVVILLHKHIHMKKAVMFYAFQK